MKAVSCAQMRELDLRTAEFRRIKTARLMEAAGRGAAEIARRMLPEASAHTGCVLMLAGRGNNGGDVFSAAYFLKKHFGILPEVRLVCEPAELRGDALEWFKKMKAARIPFKVFPQEKDWHAMSAAYAATPLSHDLIIDGILGIGIKGPARGAAAAAIKFVNLLGRHAPVLALDVPSGLDADTGKAEGEAVFADVTATMGLPKRGLLMPEALPHVGTLEIIDIGIPQQLVEGIESDFELITAEELRRLLPRRPAASHKGDYGRLLVIAGSASYPGAAVLAVRAALRSGAGLVTALAPRRVLDALAAAAPEAIQAQARETDTGSIAATSLDTTGLFEGRFSAVVVGPGMTRHAETRAIVETVLRRSPCPVLLDADALNALEGDIGVLASASAPVVITPHPGEMARLLGKTSDEIQADRLGTAREAAEKSGAVTVLKGAGTVVAKKGLPLAINRSGNAGMAKGGMGDVLSGLMGGLLAQGMDAFDAARLAVFLHGKAGEEAARIKSQHGMTAGDVVERLGAVFRLLSGR